MSRRREDLLRENSSVKLRDRGGFELRGDGYLGSDVGNQDEAKLHPYQSLSPQRNMEGARRFMGRGGRSSSVERREFDWHMSSGRGERVHSRSPPIGRVQKRPHLAGRAANATPLPKESRGKFDGPGNETYMDERSLKFRHGYCSDETSVEDDYVGRTLAPSSGGGASAKNSIALSHSGTRFTSGYAETSRGHTMVHMLPQFKHGREQYEGVITPQNRYLDEKQYFKDERDQYNKDVMSHQNRYRDEKHYFKDERDQHENVIHHQNRHRDEKQYFKDERDQYEDVIPHQNRHQDEKHYFKDERDQHEDVMPHQNRHRDEKHYFKDERDQHEDVITHQNRRRDEKQYFKDERDRFEDVMPLQSRHRDERQYYKDEKRYALHPEKASYPLSRTPQDFDNKHLLKGNPGSSSGVYMRDEYPSNLQDVHRKDYGEPTESFASDDYERILHLDHRKEYETGQTNIRCRQCDVYGSSRVEHEDYPHSEFRDRVNDDHNYLSNDDVSRKFPSYVRADRHRFDLAKETVTDPMVQSTLEAEDAHPLPKRTGARAIEIIQRERASDYVDLRRSLDTARQAGDYVDSGYAHAKFSRVSEIQKHGMPGSRSASGYGSYPVPGYRADKARISPELRDDEDTQRLIGRTGRSLANDHAAYNKPLKRKYSTDEKINSTDDRSGISSEWIAPVQNHGFDDYGEEWINGNSRGLRSKEPSRHGHNHYLEAEKMFDEIFQHQGSTSRSSNQIKLESIQHSKESYRSADTYSRGYKRSSFLKGSGHFNHVNRRSDIHKHRLGRNSSEHDNYMVRAPRDSGLTEEMEGSLSHDQPEESEGFKQTAHMAFLEFSKRLVENPVARKLYKEQGKAGSLFCIVCRRSSSKEFLDTRSLAKHAVMSHKVGLRAQHLGLHKAICVLMGWDTVIGPELINWVPQDLSYAEALAQKEDLILWPPVVIVHNISLSNSNHKEWEVISTEALGAFLRAKGFTQGKVNICLGNPGDQSVLLVKFLGTFTGLNQAERLHKYFAKEQHGRMEFEQAVSSVVNRDNMIQESTVKEKTEERLLYGYMGIAEDLDRVDFDTKKRCMIKSMKDINELADAPVKGE